MDRNNGDEGLESTASKTMDHHYTKTMGKTRQEIISKIHLLKIFLSDIFSCKLGSNELENFNLLLGNFVH